MAERSAIRSARGAVACSKGNGLTATIELAVSVIAVGGQLGLAVMAATRMRRSATAAPLLALAIVMTLWTLSARANRMHLDRGLWHTVGTSVAPWLPALAVLYVYAFLGRRRDAWMTAVLTAAGSVSLTACLAPFVPRAAAFERSAAWDVAYLATLLGCLGISTFHLWTARKRFVRPEAAMQLRLVVTAWLIGFAGGLCETLADLRFAVPRVGPVALLGTTTTLAFVTFKAIDGGTNRRSHLALGLGLLTLATSLVAQAFALSALSPRDAVVIVATASTMLMLVAILWPMGLVVRARQAEAERLVFLGRVSDQLAHDVRNPLSAIVGATDFLRVEWEQAPESTRDMLDTIGTEARRIEATLDVYRRLGDMAPQAERTDLAALARRALRNVPAGEALAIDADLPETIALVDPSLVLPALENVLRNAFEAIASRKDGGHVRLRVATEGQHAVVRVADDGPGFAPETEAWVTRPYFTTKAHGLGLGLSLVERVVDAHLGRLVFRPSDLGGVEVELAFERAGP